ncbi:MAG: hypothetical protein GXO49_01685 [Chlorobi bacterium]|nr:hypothetical protein [Chlorobiota bacterium]
MTQKIILSLIAILFASNIYSQGCEAYIPTKLGEKLTYKTSNKKGKVESYYSDKLLSIKEEDGATKYAVLRENFDKKKNLTNADTVFFYCKGSSFYIDMSSYLNNEEMSKYDESMIQLEVKNIGYPTNMKPGMNLEDGYINANISAGFMPIVFRTDVINRKVVASESVTTEAGTFQTLKITQDLKIKIAFVKVDASSITWVKKGIGTIKTETYDKKGGLMSSTELVKNW